jgi:spermidine/putrescine transport system permease protein
MPATSKWAWPFLAPALSLAAGLFLAPMLLLFVVSFWSVRNFKLTPGFGFAAWRRFIENYGTLTLYSLTIGLSVAAICTGLGLAFAYVVRFRAGRFADALIFATLITLFGGYLVKIYAWKSILGADGLFNQALTGLGLIDAPTPLLLYNRGSVIVALVHFLLPMAILPIYGALRNVPIDHLEAARDLGASGAQAFRTIIAPQCRAGIFAAFAFCFLLAAGDYVTPLLIGGAGGSMLGQFIALEFSTRFNWPAGAAMSFGLLVACLAVLGALALIVRPRR